MKAAGGPDAEKSVEEALEEALREGRSEPTPSGEGQGGDDPKLPPVPKGAPPPAPAPAPPGPPVPPPSGGGR